MCSYVLLHNTSDLKKTNSKKLHAFLHLVCWYETWYYRFRSLFQFVSCSLDQNVRYLACLKSIFRSYVSIQCPTSIFEHCPLSSSSQMHSQFNDHTITTQFHLHPSQFQCKKHTPKRCMLSSDSVASNRHQPHHSNNHTRISFRSRPTLINRLPLYHHCHHCHCHNYKSPDMCECVHPKDVAPRAVQPSHVADRRSGSRNGAHNSMPISSSCRWATTVDCNGNGGLSSADCRRQKSLSYCANFAVRQSPSLWAVHNSLECRTFIVPPKLKWIINKRAFLFAAIEMR